jgi:S1-C subfamily serine protease
MKILNIIVLFLFTTGSLFAQDLSKLYQQVNPSVVVLKVEESQAEIDKMSGVRRTVTSEGLGSGVVVSADGQIMTAAHVVQAVNKVMVEFANGEEVPASVVTLDKDSDVALVKLVWLPKNLKVATLGNSDLTSIGEQVMVIGAPLGLSHSLSSGHISGRQSSGQMSDDFEIDEFFQTDAAINHGNSGGPMFNMKGEVIGLVSFILSQSGGFEGVGFAATINVAKAQLLGEQPFWFGIDFAPLTGELARMFNVPQDMGLLVQKVGSGSPADLAGIKPGLFKMNIEGLELIAGGDIILTFDQYTINPDMNLKEFRTYIATRKPGSTFKVKVLRGGQIIELVGIVPE